MSGPITGEDTKPKPTVLGGVFNSNNLLGLRKPRIWVDVQEPESEERPPQPELLCVATEPLRADCQARFFIETKEGLIEFFRAQKRSASPRIKNIAFHFPEVPPSKKNGRVNTSNGRSFPSARYVRFARLYVPVIKAIAKDESIGRSSIEIISVGKSQFKFDLTNKAETLMDMLVDAKLLDDDNWSVVPKITLTRMDAEDDFSTRKESTLLVVHYQPDFALPKDKEPTEADVANSMAVIAELANIEREMESSDEAPEIGAVNNG